MKRWITGHPMAVAVGVSVAMSLAIRVLADRAEAAGYARGLRAEADRLASEAMGG